jgi:hypothetical protein
MKKEFKIYLSYLKTHICEVQDFKQHLVRSQRTLGSEIVSNIRLIFIRSINIQNAIQGPPTAPTRYMRPTHNLIYK